MERIRKAGALIFEEKKLLIVKPKGKPFFINPGGKYQDGETAVECLERELNEELKVRLIGYHHYRDYDFTQAAHSLSPLRLELYLVYVSGKFQPSSEIERFEWMSKQDFYDKKFNVAPSFERYVPDLIKDNLF